MNCVIGRCAESFHSRHPTWNDADTARAREAGWFIWDDRAPVAFKDQCIHGMAICPAHRKSVDGKRLEAMHNESLKAKETP